MRNWIKKAINPNAKGALRKTLKAKKGVNIPIEKLKSASKSSNPTTKKRAILAITLRKLKKS